MEFGFRIKQNPRHWMVLSIHCMHLAHCII